MDARSYELKIRKMQEGNNTYYLGFIDGLPWFLVEGETTEQVKDYAPSVLIAFLEAEEMVKKEKELRKKLHFNLQAA